MENVIIKITSGKKNGFVYLDKKHTRCGYVMTFNLVVENDTDRYKYKYAICREIKDECELGIVRSGKSRPRDYKKYNGDLKKILETAVSVVDKPVSTDKEVLLEYFKKISDCFEINEFGIVEGIKK